MNIEELFAEFDTSAIDELIKGFDPDLINDLIKFNPHTLEWLN
jgi:hypothetical protein